MILDFRSWAHLLDIIVIMLDLNKRCKCMIKNVVVCNEKRNVSVKN